MMPGEKSPAFMRYLELDAALEAWRQARSGDSAEKDALLGEMEEVWSTLSVDEQEWLEYQSFRRTAAARGDNVERKLEQLWKPPADRERARRTLEGYGQGENEPEVERARLAILKLCDGNLDRMADLVNEAKRDYRSVVARAERPAEEYWAWIRE
jgi:hypothetical protein